MTELSHIRADKKKLPTDTTDSDVIHRPEKQCLVQQMVTELSRLRADTETRLLRDIHGDGVRPSKVQFGTANAGNGTLA